MHNHGVFTSEYNLHDRLLHVLLQVWLFVLNRIFFFSTKRLLIVPFFSPHSNMNIELDIKDPDVLVVPPFCQGLRVEETPEGTAYGFFDEFL